MRHLRPCPIRQAVGVIACMLVFTSPAPAHAGHDGAPHPTGEFAALVADLAEADERIAQLGADIQRRQEGVNKALVDVARARDTVQAAGAEAEASERSVADANIAIDSAQRRFDQFASAAYMNGPPTSYLFSDAPEDVLDTAGAVETLALTSRRAVTDLQRARTEQANRASMARAAQQRAEAAAADAQRTQDAAVAALTEAHGKFGAQQAEVVRLVAERDAAQARLAAARPVATTAADASNPSAGGTAAPAAAEDRWNRQAGDGGTSASSQWDTTLPMVPSANVAGDPIAIINAVLKISSTSVQATADMGRRFLTRIGILSEPVAAADPGITNGRIPRVYGQQASEFVIRRAMSQMGVPYSWGGGNANGPSRGIDQGANTVGFDCSGLMLYAFAGVGIKLDHYSGSQYDAGRKIPSAQMRRGDLIFYGPNASQHEAMYLGDGMMLEAPYTGSQVKVSPVRTSGMTPYVTRLIDY